MEQQGHSRPEDIEAAVALVEEHPLLKDDAITRRAMKDGIGADNKPIDDFAKFVEGRGAFLELFEFRDKLRKLRDGDPEILGSIAESSLRPDLENYIN